MTVKDLPLPGLKLVEPRVYGDERGYFLETFNRDRYREAGIDVDFVQDNLSMSRKSVVRGLHFQHPHDQAKLVWAVQGEVFDVAVDLRVGSPTFGKWHAERLSETNCRQLFVPAGFAHGFAVLSDRVLFAYKCSDYYAVKNEWTIAWDDPAIGIEWPVGEPELSVKDRAAPKLSEIDPVCLPKWIER